MLKQVQHDELEVKLSRPLALRPTTTDIAAMIDSREKLEAWLEGRPQNMRKSSQHVRHFGFGPLIEKIARLFS